MKAKVISVAVLAALSITACSKSEEGKPTEQPPVRVSVMPAAMSEMAGERVYSGTVEESSATVLSFPVGGTVKTVRVNEGDRVSRGQLIASLDNGTLQNTYDIAKATLDQAQDAYNRMKMLHDSNSLPEMQWVEVQNTLKQAQSAEAIAAKALKDADLYAPVSGYVAEKFMQPGMTAAPIAPVVKIVEINPVKVNVSIPENEISGISDHQSASITVGALGGERFTGAITEKGVSADPLTRAYSVRVTVQNPDGRLLPGMICDVVLDSAEPVQSIVLPADAVLLDANNRHFVWLMASGRAAKRYVDVAGITDSGIALSGGITAGDSVIVAGQQKVSEGTAVVAVQ